MLGSDDQTNRKDSSKLIGRCTVSCLIVFLTQLALTTVPHFFPAFSLLTYTSLSVLVLLAAAGFGRCCRRLLGVHASAPALVFFNILFIWGVYIAVVRQAISPLMDIVFNGELSMLIIGLYSILSSDPGVVTYGSSSLNKLTESSVSKTETHDEELEPSAGGIRHEYPTEESSVSVRRVRYCRTCKAHIKGLDHHCPAFENCIGQKNHVLFMVLLAGFVITEASYIACSSQFATKSRILDKTGWEGLFLTWHIYCVCLNIKTDEWINWKKYPEFQLNVQPQPGQGFAATTFINPYNKGILRNVKEFLASKE